MRKQRLMPHREYLRCWKLQLENISEKTQGENITEMLQTAGIDTILALPYQSMMKGEK